MGQQLNDWRKPRRSTSNGGACVETAANGEVVGVRDSKQGHMGEGRTVLRFSPRAWRSFTEAISQR